MIENNLNKIEIIPAILPEDFRHLEKEINFVKKAVQISAKYVQIDVVDGKFAQTTTWPFNQKNPDTWNLLKNQEMGMPNWEVLNFEIDLMVMDQLGEAMNWINAGASRLIGHIESFDKNFTNGMSLDEYTKLTKQSDYKVNLDIKELEDFINLKDEFNTEIVLSLNPATKLSVIEPFLDSIDGVQFMGNDKIGYHGVELNEEILPTIEKLRLLKEDMPIGIDIGVNFKTLKKLGDAGVTRFSSGSAILKSEDPEKTISDMLTVIKDS